MSNHLKRDRAILCDLLKATNTSLGRFLSYSVEDNQPIDVVVNPTDYTDPAVLRNDLQALSLVSKCPWAYDTDPAVLRAAALDTVRSCEEQCRVTNDRLCFQMVSFDPFTRQVLDYARYICMKILGPFSLTKLDFSPGASVGIKGQQVNLIDKLHHYPVCTSKAYTTVVWNVLHFLPLYSVSCGLITRTRGSVTLNASLPIVKGNSFDTVPKDWKKVRPIFIEPLGNMLVQKGIGSAISRRLKQFGLDIATAQQLHGELAKRGSIDDSLSTIDLRSASDTIAYELVRYLLPPDWFRQLDAVRSKFSNLAKSGEKEQWIENEKFSSMGNGFTFELETLIFYSLALGVRRLIGERSDCVRVYGDDIIVSSNLAVQLVTVLTECGFTINTEKTFLSGPFKESCGYDYLNGIPVRPVYLTADYPSKDSRKDDWTMFYYGLANRIVEIADNLSDHPDFLDDSFKQSWISVIQCIDQKLRCFGPSGFGDSVLIGSSNFRFRVLPVDREERRLTLRGGFFASRSTWCLHMKVMVRRGGSRNLPADHDHLLSCILAGISPSGVEIRNTPQTFRTTWVTRFGLPWSDSVLNQFFSRKDGKPSEIRDETALASSMPYSKQRYKYTGKVWFN